MMRLHLADIFGHELGYFQIDGNELPKPSMKKEHIYLVILAVIGQNVLVADVCKSLTKFKKELF